MVSRGYRSLLKPGDPAAIEALVRATGFFSVEEIGIARELADDGLAAGQDSHYRFLLARAGEMLEGYICFGRIPCTVSSWDLYWIAVQPHLQAMGIGRGLIEGMERQIRALKGSRVYVDTSSRSQYDRTRAFYRVAGYREVASFPDFYGPGDGKLVLGKVLPPA